MQQRVEELDDELRQANESGAAERVRSDAELASHREARRPLESERDELLRRIGELEAQLREVGEQRQRAESDFIRFGRELWQRQRRGGQVEKPDLDQPPHLAVTERYRY